MADEIKTVAQLSDKFDAIDKKIDEMQEKLDTKDPEVQNAIKQLSEDQAALAEQMRKESEKRFARQQIKETEGWNEKKALELGKMVYCTMGNMKPEFRPMWDPEKAKQYYEEINGLYEKADLGTPLTAGATTGSYNIAVDYLSEIARVKIAESQLIPKVTRIPTKTQTTYFPKTLVVPSFTYVASDGGATTESNPTFAQGTLTDYQYVLWISLSEGILEDNIVNLGQYFRDTISEAMVTKMESEFLVGSGSPTTGVFNDTSINLTVMDEGSFSSGSMDYIDDVIGDLTLAERVGAAWIMSPSVWDHFKSLQNAVGSYFIPDVQGMARQEFKGFPVILSDNAYAMTDSTASRVMCVLGNPKHMIWGDRLGLEVGMYDRTEFAITYCEVILRARFRMSYTTAIPGAFSGLKTSA